MSKRRKELLDKDLSVEDVDDKVERDVEQEFLKKYIITQNVCLTPIRIRTKNHLKNFETSLFQKLRAF